MEYRLLGNTGMPVSALSFGSWITFGKQIEGSTAEKLMKIAYEAGINFFDNAEVYARGRSEKVMGKILKKLKWSRDSYAVSSKVFFGAGKLPMQKGLHRKHITEACHQAMKRLNVEYLDLYFCHRPDPQTPIEEVVYSMNILIRQGKVFHWGTSEWNAIQIRQAIDLARLHHLIPPSMEQPQYNLLHRYRMETEYKALFAEFKLGTTIWSPLASGLLTGKYIQSTPDNTRLGISGMEWLKEQKLNNAGNLKKVAALKEISDELGISLALMSLAWCLKNTNVSTVILGASRTEQLKENLSAIEQLPLLTDEVMKRIEGVAAAEIPLPS
jgi:voltage-dependent potassium channel beta subunit